MKLSRRHVLAALPSSLLAAPGTKIRLGGPVFLKSDDPRELAREHRRLGYSAAYCPKADLKDTERIRAIEKAFAADNVVIAEVGAWVNMLDPDAEKRSENMKYVGERLALAEAVGARCCVDIAGSYNPSVWYGPHPKNFSQEFFDATVENCRQLIDEVKPKRTKFTIEMMGWALPEGPEEYLKLIKAVDRPGVRRPHGRLQRHQQPRALLPQRRVHRGVFPHARTVDHVVPREGPGVEGGDERPLRGGDSRAR